MAYPALSNRYRAHCTQTFSELFYPENLPKRNIHLPEKVGAGAFFCHLRSLPQNRTVLRELTYSYSLRKVSTLGPLQVNQFRNKCSLLGSEMKDDLDPPVFR